MWTKNQNLLVYLWVFFLPVQLSITQQSLGFKLAISDIFIFLLIPTLFLSKITKNKNFKITLFPYLTVILLILTVSLFKTFQVIGYIPSYAVVNKYLGFIFLAVTFCILYFVLRDDIKRVYTAMKILLVSSFIFNILSVLSYTLNFWFGVASSFLFYNNRIAGLLFNPNAYGCYLLVVFMVQLSLLIKEGSILPKAFMWPNLILCFVAIVLTFSRTTWIGLFVGIVILSLFYGPRLLTKIVPVALAGLSSIFILLGFGFINDFVFFSIRSTSISLRMQIIRYGAAYFLSYPIFGIGLGSFLEFSGQFLVEGRTIPNTYLWVLVETGIIGFMALMAFLFKITKNFLAAINNFGKEKPLVIGIFASFAAILAFMMGVEGFYQRPFWFTVVISEVFYNLARRNKE